MHKVPPAGSLRNLIQRFHEVEAAGADHLLVPLNVLRESLEINLQAAYSELVVLMDTGKAHCMACGAEGDLLEGEEHVAQIDHHPNCFWMRAHVGVGREILTPAMHQDASQTGGASHGEA